MPDMPVSRTHSLSMSSSSFSVGRSIVGSGYRIFIRVCFHCAEVVYGTLDMQVTYFYAVNVMGYKISAVGTRLVCEHVSNRDREHQLPHKLVRYS